MCLESSIRAFQWATFVQHLYIRPIDSQSRGYFKITNKRCFTTLLQLFENNLLKQNYNAILFRGQIYTMLS